MGVHRTGRQRCGRAGRLGPARSEGRPPVRPSAVLASADTGSWPDRLLDALADLQEPLLIVLDDAHHLTAEDCAAAVLRLASGMPPPHRLVVAARRLPAQLEPLRAILGGRHLGTADLAFRSGEAAKLIEALRGSQAGGGEDLAAMVEATAGWASALVLAATAPGPAAAAAAGTHPDGDRKPIRRSAVVGTAVDGILGRLSADERGALIQLAQLPSLSPQVVDRVTGHQATSSGWCKPECRWRAPLPGRGRCPAR